MKAFYHEVFTMAGERKLGVGVRDALPCAGVVCIKSTHNVLKAKRMHSCHHDTSGTLGDRLASDCDFAVYVESSPNVKLGCLS